MTIIIFKLNLLKPHSLTWNIVEELDVDTLLDLGDVLLDVGIVGEVWELGLMVLLRRRLLSSENISSSLVRSLLVKPSITSTGLESTTITQSVPTIPTLTLRIRSSMLLRPFINGTNPTAFPLILSPIFIIQTSQVTRMPKQHSRK